MSSELRNMLNGGQRIITPQQREQMMQQAVHQRVEATLNFRDVAAMNFLTANPDTHVATCRVVAEELCVGLGLAPSVEWFRQWDDRFAFLSEVKKVDQ